MTTYNGKGGQKYQTAANPFAGGGEGDLFEIIGNPKIVAKIFKVNKRTTERERKLSVMVGIKPHVTRQYSWPLDMLYESNKFVGYVMPKVTGNEKLRNIYVYDKREGKPWALYVAIARNLASAVHNVHQMGQVVGDLNPENILVEPETGLVTLVDTDSFHITDASGKVYRCNVGMPEYVAPELQGKHFPSAKLPTFTKETDLFSLSVLIFSLLMNGAHPFACRTFSGSSSQFQPVDNIAEGTCAYFPESRKSGTDIPIYAPALDSLPQGLQTLFKRAFIDGHKDPRSRPTAPEYYRELETLEKNIKDCGANRTHFYYSGATYCPWCNVEANMAAIRQSKFVPPPPPPPPPPPDPDWKDLVRKTLVRGAAIVALLYIIAMIIGGINLNNLTVDNWDGSQPLIQDSNAYSQGAEKVSVTNKIVFSYRSNSYETQSHSIPFTLSSPPLEVTYSVIPEMIEHQKMVYPSPSSTRGRLVTTEIPNRDSWFEIVITDSFGERVLETGYGTPPDSKSGYGNQEGFYKIYTAGDYRLNINFNKVIVDVEISQQ